MNGAISGQFNANIIARELGLADKQDVSHSGAITHVESEYVDVE
jgi:hypothetical protein